MLHSLSLAALGLSGFVNGLTPVSSITCNGQTYEYLELAGYGYVPSDATDKYHDTIGGIGSAIAIDRSTWKKSGSTYTGTFYTLPDRGWNTEGTVNYHNRLEIFNVTITNMPDATVQMPSEPNIDLHYLDTILFDGPRAPTTGLDATGHGALIAQGFPKIPAARYTGNGFCGPGKGGHRLSLDSEGLVRMTDGTFWVSDEYGPYVYHFSSTGKLMTAIRPPPAFIPRRNGSESFSADSPTICQDESDDVNPPNPVTGRDNNHGFEGLTISNDETTLYVLLQAALVQDGGTSSSTEHNTRMLVYDITDATAPDLTAEYVVQLPMYNSSGSLKTAAQSEMHYISSTQFLVLARDSNAGHGQSSSKSLYRHADVIDITNATNIAGTQYDAAAGAVAYESTGTLMPGITPVTYCKWLNYNDNAQLRRFGVHNGGRQNPRLLNEKWESLALAPVNPENGGKDGEFFLFSMSDNDFITQHGQLDGGKYKYADDSGFNLDSQILAFRVKLPAAPAS